MRKMQNIIDETDARRKEMAKLKVNDKVGHAMSFYMIQASPPRHRLRKENKMLKQLKAKDYGSVADSVSESSSTMSKEHDFDNVKSQTLRRLKEKAAQLSSRSSERRKPKQPQESSRALMHLQSEESFKSRGDKLHEESKHAALE